MHVTIYRLARDPDRWIVVDEYGSAAVERRIFGSEWEIRGAAVDLDALLAGLGIGHEELTEEQ